MLTSACLSNGAQGKAVKDRCYDSDEMSYSNFELGVLFCSRIQGVTSTDRIYGWDPDYCNNCCCRDGKIRVSVDDGSSSIEEKVEYHSSSSSSNRVTMQKKKKKKDVRFIHLPIPYNLEPPMYQEDEDDVDMWTTPYFHEIPDGTGCIGQMKLTPLGKMLASSSND
mmetsp:Transcript_15045/g.22059  ORF Transcript_15045/g.22059 Transcript_15045/m.22059 type:complete len:166 (+) Transcript_15045:462-959(+)